MEQEQAERIFAGALSTIEELLLERNLWPNQTRSDAEVNGIAQNGFAILNFCFLAVKQGKVPDTTYILPKAKTLLHGIQTLK